MKDDTKIIHAGRDPFDPLRRRKYSRLPRLNNFISDNETVSNTWVGSRREGSIRITRDTNFIRVRRCAHRTRVRVGTVLNPSGLQAITMAFMAFIEPGITYL